LDLSLYAFAIGISVVVLLASVAAWAALPNGRFRRRNRSDAWRHLPTELQTILDEFANAMEASQTEIRKAANTGDAFMAAVKPIELVLRDFKTRITELEKNGSESKKQATELNLLLTQCQTSLEANAGAVERIDARLGEFSRQLASLTNGLSDLKRLSESSISRHEAAGEELRAVRSDLATMRGQLVDLSRRLDGGDAAQARSSTFVESINSDLTAARAESVGLSQRFDALTESVGKSVTAVGALSRETAQRIDGLEPRLMWKVEELEARINSKLAALDRRAIDDEGDVISWSIGRRPPQPPALDV
jgi:chromosome segregation ATPase